MENYNNNMAPVQQEQDGPNLREILEFFWRLKWWVLAGGAVALVVAFLYLRMQTPIYKTSSTIMLNAGDTNSELSMLGDIVSSGVPKKKKVGNEVYILQNPGLMTKVVEQLGLQTSYGHYIVPVGDSHVNVGRRILNFKHVSYYNDNPFTFCISKNELYPEDLLPNSVGMEFKYLPDSSFSVKKLLINGKKFKAGKKQYRFGEAIDCGNCSISLKLDNKDDMVSKDIYSCSWRTPVSVARTIGKNLTVEAKGTQKSQNDVIVISLNDANRARGRDIVNALVNTSNEESRQYTSASHINTVEFIDKRLADISRELGNVETIYKNYQSSRSAVNLASQTQLTMTSDMEYQNQLTEVRLQQRVLDMITNYLAESGDGEYKVIPTNIGISDGSLNSIISTYNSLVTERNRMVSSSSETNPRVLSMNSQLEDGKKSIEISIANLVKIYGIREKELVKTLSQSQRKIADIPQQQFELQQITRKINVIEPLYLLLQQKREEAQIAMYSQTDNFRIIEGAYTSPVPVSPRSSIIYLVALLIGICIAPAFIWLRTKMRTKVETKKDIEDNIDAPVLAVLPKSKGETYALLDKNGRDTSSESFRMLRSNIQYLPDVKVLQLTSSMPGEGKSYIASNLALSISHTGKKVVLVGMDLRKPSLQKVFKDIKVEKFNTVVGYLIGKCSNIADMIIPSGVSPTLDIIVAGPVPPNPTELLSVGKEAEIIAYLRERYDYVIIDSAPYLPVSDSFLINNWVDATLFCLRADYTDLKLLPEIDQAIKSTTKPMKNVSIVLNGLDLENNKYRYGYGAGYGYGYGHGYGYGYGYSEKEDGSAPGKHHKFRK